MPRVMGFDDFCNTGLILGLGISSPPVEIKPQKPTIMAKFLEPSLTLSLSGEPYHLKRMNSDDSDDLHRPDSVASSFSKVSVKREREIGSEEAAEIEDDDGSNGRKKLRLSKVQSALLEESFKRHSTLNTKQKQDLARELKLRPRQVEVWFQNRRARTKLKQTEVDCEFLKKCCETLTDENQRLQKELQELRSLKLAAQPFYMNLPAATLTVCPSCERIGGGGAVPTESAAKGSYLMAPKPHFYSPFTNQSAAY